MSTKHALVIGNSDYQDSKLAKLTAPVEDVSGLVEVLKDPEICNFENVTLLTNESTATALRSIASFFAKKHREDLLLLYFSGHGVLDSSGRLYLSFKDTEYDLLSGTAIAANFITQEMDRCRSQRQVLILDCCHSGAFSKGAKSALGARVGIASAFEGNGFGRIVLTASDSTQFAWEGNHLIGQAENSLFTHYLIEGLRTGKADLNTNGSISLDDLYDYVYQQVLRHTPNQTPGKWSYQTTEELLIAKNPRANAKSPSSLEEKQQAQDSDSFIPPTSPETGAMQLTTKETGAMNEKASPRSSKTLLAAIVFLVIFAGGWFFYQSSQGSSLGMEALTAKEQMLSQQSKAQSAEAPSFAEDIYNEAIAIAQQGEQELEENNYTAARISFDYAAELFGKATREADENLIAASEIEEDNELRQPASLARTEMRDLKNQAVNANARTLAGSAFDTALQEERKAEREFDAGDYPMAELSYKRAGELFKKARNEAQVKALESVTDLRAMRRTVESLKQEMQREKAAAERVEANRLASELFESARKREFSGDKNLQANTKKGYLAAQAAFSSAKDGYQKAAEAAKAKTREEAIKAKQREDSLKAEADEAELRNKANEAKSMMAEMKEMVPGSASDKTANSTYQDALQQEASGERQFQAGEFQTASNSFLQAERLFIRSAEQIRMALENAKKAAPDDPKPAVDEDSRAKAAVISLVNNYSQSLENKDIEALTTAFKENENRWTPFFRMAKDISVDIEEQSIRIDGNTARVTVKLNMSYFNTTKNSKENSPVTKEWKMQEVNGQWKVISQN